MAEKEEEIKAIIATSAVNICPTKNSPGKRHAQHVCKVCLSLPQDVQADMERCNEIEKIISKYPMSSQDGELLERYALLYQDKVRESMRRRYWR